MPQIGDLELHEIAVDWTAFANLSTGQRQSCVILCERLEKTGWFIQPHRRRANAWAFIDISDYQDSGEYVKMLKKESTPFRAARKADKRGYYAKFFNHHTFVGDIVAINTSAPARQGKPMSSNYLQTVEERGGYATKIRKPTMPTQGVFWNRYFGTFRTQPGHRQGKLVVHEELLSYLIIRRIGNIAIYTSIIGHYDHLRDGVVHKMHLEFVKHVLDSKSAAAAGAPPDISMAGLRYILYAGFSGPPGIVRWKKDNLFRPGLFSFDLDPAVKSITQVDGL